MSRSAGREAEGRLGRVPGLAGIATLSRTCLAWARRCSLRPGKSRSALASCQAAGPRAQEAALPTLGLEARPADGS